MNKYNSKETFHSYKYKKNKFEIVYVNKDFITKDIHLRVVKNYPRPLKTSKQIWQTSICHRKNMLKKILISTCFLQNLFYFNYIVMPSSKKYVHV